LLVPFADKVGVAPKQPSRKKHLSAYGIGLTARERLYWLRFQQSNQ